MVSIRTVLSLLPSEHSKAMTRVTVLSIIQSGLEVLSLAAAVPIFYYLIGSNIENSDLKFSFLQSLSWESLLITIMAVFITKNAITLWIARQQSNFVSAVSVSLSEQLYRNFYKQPWTSYLRNNSAETVRKIKTTPSDFAHYVLHGYINLLTDGFICTLMIGMIVLYDYRVVLVILILCLPVGFFYFLFRKKIIARVDKSFRELTPQASVILTQGVDSFAEARIYHKEDFFIKRFMKIRLITSQQLADLKTATTLPSKLFEITAIVCLCALIFYSNVIATLQSGIIPILGLMLIAMFRIIPSLNRILITISQMEGYAYSASELKNSFEITKDHTDSANLSFSRQIQLQNISFRYNDSKWILQKLNQTINKGEFIVIEGPSGTGKTTLLYILAGLLYPTEGKIIVDDVTLTPAHVRDFQNKISYVPQAPIILQETLARNVAFAEEGNIDYKKLHQVLDLVCLKDFINSLPEGVNTSLGENGLNLSGGQRQRVSLARAVYRDSEILLLDEVTNQLDDQAKEQVLVNLKKLCQDGKTIVLTSHDPLAKKYATHVWKI